ncbi:MAG: cytochrome C oxidase subunit IV family protein [Gemmatimonadota bacterium]
MTTTAGISRNALIGFAVAGACFGGIDGWVMMETATSAAAGALIGAFIGAGLVVLASRPRPQDTTTAAPEHDHDHPNYMAVWAGLFALTMIEVGVAFVTLSKVAIILVLVALAIWKALLVALYYMHLKMEPRRMWLLAASPLPLAAILVLAVVIGEGW